MTQTSSAQAMALVFRGDLVLAFRRWEQIAQPVVFFAMVTTLVPLALSPQLEELREIAGGVLWIAALLAALLGLEFLYRADHADGSLEQMLLSGQPLALLALAKTAAHWTASGLPLVLASPVLATSLGVPTDALGTLMISIALGTGILSALGAVGAALTLGLRRGSVLLSLLVLPLTMPALIFGARAVDMAIHGEVARGPLLLLAAMFVLSLTLSPIAVAAALRISQE